MDLLDLQNIVLCFYVYFTQLSFLQRYMMAVLDFSHNVSQGIYWKNPLPGSGSAVTFFQQPAVR